MSMGIQISGSAEDLEILRQRIEQMIVIPASQNKVMARNEKLGKGQEKMIFSEGYEIFYSYNNAVVVRDGDRVLVTDKKFKRAETEQHIQNFVAGRVFETVKHSEIEKYFPINR